MNKGAPRDARYVTRLLETSRGQLVHARALRRGAPQARGRVLPLLHLDAKSKTAGDTEEANEPPEEAPAPVKRSAPRRQRAAKDDDDEPKETQLKRHIQDEKEHEKELKHDQKKLATKVDAQERQIEDLQERLHRLEKGSSLVRC